MRCTSLCMWAASIGVLAALSGCCVCNNPFAVATLEDREQRLDAEVRDLQQALAARKSRALSSLQSHLTRGSGFSTQNLAAGELEMRWKTRHGRVVLRGALQSDGDVRPKADASLTWKRSGGRP